MEVEFSGNQEDDCPDCREAGEATCTALGCLNTPPVGTTQFVGCTIGQVSVGTVMKTIWPFYGGLVAALLLVTYVPAFSLWLPQVLLSR
jgi:TRAP-type C4-dicarboxylate transport system permease large subunit